MEGDTVVVRSQGIQDGQESDQVSLLKGATKELRTRANHYASLQARQKSNVPASITNLGPRDLAGAFLHDNPQRGYSSPGLVWQDDEDVLNIARALPGCFVCLKVWYVKQVNPAWNIPMRTVMNLRAWVNRQILASQNITPLPNLNTKAITTLPQVWELLSQFDASQKHKSTFVSVTPLDLAGQKPIVELLVMRPKSPATTAISRRTHTMATQSADSPSNLQNQAMQTEIDRLTRSIEIYKSRMCVANDENRSLKADLRDAQKALNDSEHQVKELQRKYEEMKKRCRGHGSARNEGKASKDDLSDLLEIPSDSLEQAQDIVEEIETNVAKFAAVVEAYGIIRPSFTNRELAELQVTADVIAGAAEDIQNMPIKGYHEEDKDGKMVERGGVEDKDGDVANGKA